MVGDILQPTHLLFVLVVALLVLGPKRLPEVGRTLGNGIRDFRSAINGESHESRDEIGSQPWHSDGEPEQNHEFAHESETTPESHEFAHEAPAVPATVPEAAQTVPPSNAQAPAPSAPAAQPADAQPVEAPAQPVEAPAAQPADAQPVEAPAQPAATSDTAVPPNKHEFAYESSEAAENSAGPRT